MDDTPPGAAVSSPAPTGATPTPQAAPVSTTPAASNAPPAASSAAAATPAADVADTNIFRDEESRDLIRANFTHFREDPFSFLKQVSLHYAGTGWRGYNEVIGQPIFYKGFSEQMKGRVMRSAIVRRKIAELAQRRADAEAGEAAVGDGGDEGAGGGVGVGVGVGAGAGAGAGLSSATERLKAKERRRDEIEKQLVDVAEGIVDGMICKFENKRFIRVRISISSLGVLW